MSEKNTDKPAIDNAFTAKTLNQKSGDATYAGALSFMRRKYSKDLTGVDAVVWGVPLDTATSNRPGTRFGPRGVREASVIMDNDPQFPFGAYIFDDLAVVDYGDCHFYYGKQADVPDAITGQATEILNSESSPYLLSIGGDHFVTYPLLKAHAEKHGPLALVQFDAHQDTWDDEEGAVDHGTMITRAVKDGLIDPARSIQIGIRTHADQDYGIEIIDGFEAQNLSSKEIAKRIFERTGNNNAYLTFDIDCLDPAFAPGTGTPVAGGLATVQALQILRELKGLDIVGSDVVEVSPAYDHANVTAIAGSTIAMFMLGLLWQRRQGS